MTYAVGSTIQATDFNNFAGGSTANISGQINSVWSTGNGNSGYGQTAVANVSVGANVSATSWASMVNAINNARLHQSGSGSGITAPAAGTKINYLSTLSSSITSCYTSRLSNNTVGSLISGSTYTASATAATNVDYPETTLGAYRYVTFSSGDAARYFFNAGGQIIYQVTNVTNNNGTARSASARTLLLTNFAGISGFKGYSNSGRLGTGGTVARNSTGFGYWNLSQIGGSPGWQWIVDIQSTTASYTTDYMRFYAALNSSTNVSGHGDNGNIVAFALNLSSPAHVWDAALDITVSYRIDIYPPESTYLTNSWGTPVVS